MRLYSMPALELPAKGEKGGGVHVTFRIDMLLACVCVMLAPPRLAGHVVALLGFSVHIPTITTATAETHPHGCTHGWIRGEVSDRLRWLGLRFRAVRLWLHWSIRTGLRLLSLQRLPLALEVRAGITSLKPVHRLPLSSRLHCDEVHRPGRTVAFDTSGLLY